MIPTPTLVRLLITRLADKVRRNAKAYATFIVGAVMSFAAKHVEVIPGEIGPALEVLVGWVITTAAVWATRNADRIDGLPAGPAVSTRRPI